MKELRCPILGVNMVSACHSLLKHLSRNVTTGLDLHCLSLNV